jgi:pyroglutamyl-peptidase
MWDMQSTMTRILITGFGPFPGAPSNPTMRIVRHLVCLKRAGLANVVRLGRVLPTEWGMLKGFRQTIQQCQPDVVLMFGLAGRRRTITPEARAINLAGYLRTDAAGHTPASRHLSRAGPSHRHGLIDTVRMVAGMKRAGIAANVSRNAGDYLCNALYWTALETGVPAIFVHIPRPRNLKRPKGQQKLSRTQIPRPTTRRPTMATIERAAERAMLFALAAARAR